MNFFYSWKKRWIFAGLILLTTLSDNRFNPLAIIDNMLFLIFLELWRTRLIQTVWWRPWSSSAWPWFSSLSFCISSPKLWYLKVGWCNQTDLNRSLRYIVSYKCLHVPCTCVIPFVKPPLKNQIQYSTIYILL